MVGSNPSSWFSYLIWAEYAHNTLRSSSTGRSPFECQFGYTPTLLTEQEIEVAVPFKVQTCIMRCRRIWRTIRAKLLRTSGPHQIQANRRCRPAPSLCVDQRVWLFTRNLPLRVESRKLCQKFAGPFKIARRVNPITYRLTLPCSLKINPTFHVSLLKPVLCSPFVAPGKAPPPLRVIGGRPAFTVHRILDVRQVR